MPIVTVSRWDIAPEEARQIAREATPLLKQQGAESVKIGRIFAGQYAGQTIMSVQYESFEAFGRALEKQKLDTKYQELYQQALQSSETGRALQDRTIITIEEL